MEIHLSIYPIYQNMPVRLCDNQLLWSLHWLLKLGSHCQVGSSSMALSQTQGTDQVQALADISHSALCCQSNDTHASIANTPKSEQLGGTPTIPPSYIRGGAVVQECGEGQTDRQTAYASREM